MHARSTRFPLFDSLRAIAALSVLGAHAAFFSGTLTDESLLRPFAARLDVGVTIFFLISGFLLYRPFVEARLRDEARPRTLAFAWRRVLRIVPAYWVALTITVLVLGMNGVFTSEGIPTYYGFAQIYQGDMVFNGLTQAWTLCVEVTFYAMLPLYALALRALPGSDRRAKLRGEWWALAALAGAGILYQALLIGIKADPQQAAATQGLLYLPAFLDQFAIGMALAVLSVQLATRARLPRALRPLDRFPGIAWAGALAVFLLVSVGIGLDGRGILREPFTVAQYFARHYGFALIAVGVLLPAIFGDQTRGLVRRLLANPALLYIGLVSYGVYLYHQLVYAKLNSWDFTSGGYLFGFIHPYIAWLAVGILASTALATVSYWVLERPLLSLKRLVPDRREPGEPLGRAEPVAALSLADSAPVAGRSPGG